MAITHIPNPTGPLDPATKAAYDVIFGEDYCGPMQTSDIKRILWHLGINPFADGGLAWEVGKPYQAGTIVTEGGITYISVGDHISETGDVVLGSPSQPGQTQWITAPVLERGGVMWLASLGYLAGDIVTDDLTGNVYVAVASSSNIQPSTDVTAASWAAIKVVEQGGVAYAPSITYAIGDMIIADDGTTVKAYYCTTSYTSAAAGTPAQFLIEIANWTPLPSSERGGIAWSLAQDYVIGDLVTEGGITYICSANHTPVTGDVALGSPSQPTQTSWSTSIERGGVAWGLTQDYLIGDIVTEAGITYICNADHTSLTGDVTLGSPSQPNQISWDIIVQERGGIAWALGIDYLVGDLVTVAGITYYCIVGHTSLTGDVADGAPDVASQTNWSTSTERGGIAWGVSQDYVIGDLVTEGGITYICSADHTPITGDVALGSPSQPNQTSWSTVTERGGVWYQRSTDYKVGDIITADDGTNVEVYRCILDYTSAVGGNPADFLAERDTDLRWSLMETSVERGGILWITTTDYLIGDTVIDDIDGKSYTAIVDNAASQPSTVASTDWELTEGFEKGGVAYAATTTYEIGDIVSDSTTSPRKVFLSLVDANVGNPLPTATGLNAWWQELDTALYNSPTGGDLDGDGVLDLIDGTVVGEGGGQHCPLSALGEYPDTTIGPERIGAVWRVSGLGRDVAGDSIEHTMAGGSLAGIGVADGDQFTWVDGATPNEVWLWTPQARVVGERGGVLWRSGENYEIGDMVIDTTTGEIFVAIAATVPGGVPSVTPTEWELARTSERGGIFYQASTSYAVGDIITADVDNGTDPIFTDVYRCITAITSAAGGAPTDFFAEIASWTLTSPVTERGGVFYQPTTDYIIGDIITANNNTTDDVYRCIVDYTSAAGGTPVEFNSEIANWVLINQERAGVAWRVTQDYLIGDIVTEAGLTYTCNADHTSLIGDVVLGSPSQLTQTSWDLVSLERGGVAWSLTQDYLIGDVATEGGNAYLCNADHIPVTGDTLLGSPTQPTQTSWDIINQERGGILHDEAGIDYVVGDTVTLPGTEYIYHCILDHTSAPVTPGTCHGDIVHWSQAGLPILEYNFTTNVLGDTVTVPPGIPAGPHTYEFDGLTGIPDENGPHWFSVSLGTAGFNAEVFVDGFKLPPIEFDTSVDGYVYIESPVADNSWVQIKI